MIEFQLRKRALGVYVALLAMVAATLVSLSVAPASAHVGDIKVTKQTCVSASEMQATYEVGWSRGTASGKLYQRSGLYGQGGDAGSNISGWTFVKNVSGVQGSASFTLNHPKSSFTGGNGPWWSSKVVFSDGYGVAADTRVEGFDWNTCSPPAVKDADASVSITPNSCTTPEKLVLGPAVNATWGTPTGATGPGTYSVTATGDAGPPQHLFADGQKTKTFTGTLKDKQDPNTNPECRQPDKVAVPAVPSVTDDCGPNNAYWNKPTDTASVVWTLVNGELIASTTKGYVFEDGTTKHNYGTVKDSNEPCPVVTPPVVIPPVVTPPVVTPPVVTPPVVTPVVAGTSAVLKPKVALNTRCTGTTTFVLDNRGSDAAVPFRLKVKHHGKVIWTKTIRVGADKGRTFTKRFPNGALAMVTASGVRAARKVPAICPAPPGQAPSTGR